MLNDENVLYLTLYNMLCQIRCNFIMKQLLPKNPQTNKTKKKPKPNNPTTTITSELIESLSKYQSVQTTEFETE